MLEFLRKDVPKGKLIDLFMVLSKYSPDAIAIVYIADGIPSKNW